MARRLFKIEDFEARFVGLHHVELYPFKRERFGSIGIQLPTYEIQMKTGKLGFTPGYLNVGSSSSYHTTIRRSVRFGRAIIAAAGYLQEARTIAREDRGIPR